jgi:hypothetical protein
MHSSYTAENLHVICNENNVMQKYYHSLRMTAIVGCGEIPGLIHAADVTWGAQMVIGYGLGCVSSHCLRFGS